MILYYPLSPGMELGQNDQVAHGEMSVGERTVVVEHVSPFKVRIVRLLSTDPADYLVPELQPGAVLLIGTPDRTARR